MPRSPAPPSSSTTAASRFSHEELLRYARHLILPDVGLAGQAKLKEARVLLVGAGGLGSPAALYLAAAGVGTIGVVDADVVDATNLQRQILHGTSDVGMAKTESARARVQEINPHIRVVPFAARLTSANALDVLGEFDIVVDGSDNFPTRYLVNDACVLLGKPNVYGAVFRFDGQASLFATPEGPCYRCLFAEPPPPELVPSCAEGGILGVLPGIIGSLQALETIKWILGVGEPLVGRLLLFDARRLQFRELQIERDPHCPVCGAHPTITGLIDYDVFCGGAHGGASQVPGIEARELAREWGANAAMVVVDVREPEEAVIAHIAGARLIPLGELPRRLSQLPTQAPIVTYCHHGQRSQRAAELLRGAGFAHVRSLVGGIDAWSREVDPEIPRY